MQRLISSIDLWLLSRPFNHLLGGPIRKNSDWDAGHHYAAQHQRSFHACHLVEGWFRRLFQDPSLEAAASRARAMPLIAEDPTRVPDHIFSGPDLPLNEQVRARLFSAEFSTAPGAPERVRD